MVRLKNIKKSDSTIECDIYPEDSTLPGHVVVSIKTNNKLRTATKLWMVWKSRISRKVEIDRNVKE